MVVGEISFPLNCMVKDQFPKFSAVTPNPLATAASGSSLDVAGLQVGGLRQEKSKASQRHQTFPDAAEAVEWASGGCFDMGDE